MHAVNSRKKRGYYRAMLNSFQRDSCENAETASEKRRRNNNNVNNNNYTQGKKKKKKKASLTLLWLITEAMRLQYMISFTDC